MAKDWNALLGVRHDRFNEFGNATTPRASLQYSPGNWRFRAGYGEAFRAPTVLEQYGSFRRDRFLILGRDSLVPEESRSFGVQEFYKSGISNLIRLQVSGEQMKNEADQHVACQ